MNKRYWCGCFTRSFHARFFKINVGAKVIVTCGVGSRKYSMSVNVTSESTTLERCKDVLFLHALWSGSDYISSFFHIGKVKFLNSWLWIRSYQRHLFVKATFQAYHWEKRTLILLKDLLFLYTMITAIAFPLILARYEVFKYRHLIFTPTRHALNQHMHKSAFVFGHIWSRANLPSKTDESSSN